jgi:hypothetical protein
MLIAAVPTKFPIPWANGAGGSYIREIPVASQIGIQNGAASLTDGFPPLCFTPVDAGGTPPFGQDMNGILNQITASSQWAQAGGQWSYDGTFSGEIGGYPEGAVLANASVVGKFWISTVDNNVTDPDTGGAGWSDTGQLADSSNVYADTGTANAYAATVVPALSAHKANLAIRVKIANTQTLVSTFTPNPGTVTPAAVVRPDGNILQYEDLIAGGVYTFTYVGSSYQVAELAGACATNIRKYCPVQVLNGGGTTRLQLKCDGTYDGGAGEIIVQGTYASPGTQFMDIVGAVQYATPSPMVEVNGSAGGQGTRTYGFDSSAGGLTLALTAATYNPTSVQATLRF